MKKVVSLFLVLVLALGMSITAFPATKFEIGTGFSDLEWVNGPNYYGSGSEINRGTIYACYNNDMFAKIPGTGAFTPNSAAYDIDASSASPGTTEWTGYQKREIADGKLVVRAKMSKGSAAIDTVSLIYDGQSDEAVIKVEFVHPFKSNDPKGLDFQLDVYPEINGKSYQNKCATIKGNLRNQTDEDFGADTDYYDMEDHNILIPNEDMNNVDLYLGAGVTMVGSPKFNGRYWGCAFNEGNTYRLEVLELDKICNYVVLEDANPNGYVYDAAGMYIGRGRDHLPFRTIYYVESTLRSGGSTSSSSSSSSGSSGYSGGNRNNTPSTPAPAPVTSAQAVKNVQDAIAAAKNSPNGAAVTLQNVTTVSLDTLKQMARAAGSKDLKVNADSLNPDGSVDVRISVDPSKATSGMNLSASTTSPAATIAQAAFAKHFNNTVSAVSLSQKGSFGAPVRVAAKVDEKLNTNSLVFYSYDSASNTYTKIENPQYKVDKNGYVHFTTSVGGDIIISDKPLTRRR